MKRLVICCDGTWNTADQQSGKTPCPTNVIKFAFRVAKRDGAIQQVLFYDQGVGTGNWIDRISGGAFGSGLLDNIFDAYRFLLANYELGDELFVLGFSRGAYTARSLCGLIRKCGILKRESIAGYRAAVELYRKKCRPSDAEPRAFRRRHSIAGDDTIEIKFLGVWDTVGSLGIPIRGLRFLTKKKYEFHDTELSGAVKNAYQALAIDEFRAPFKPTLWSALPKADQVVKQVWFCGAHSDVGGGYERSGLSDITLDWMIDAARSVGLAFDAEVMTRLPLKPDPKSEPHVSKRGLYRLTLGIDRAIGLNTRASRAIKRTAGGPDITQSVHSSVLARWLAVPTYRPPSLVEYFKTPGSLEQALAATAQRPGSSIADRAGNWKSSAQPARAVDLENANVPAALPSTPAAEKRARTPRAS